MKKQAKDVKYLTFRQLIKKHDFLTESGWRKRIFNNKEFREKCIRKFGGKILIKEDELFEYIDESVKK